MKRHTLEDIDIEIEETELEILELKKSIHEDEPAWREPHRLKTGDIGIGYVPLAERYKKVGILEGKVVRLQKERTTILAKQKASGAKKLGHGELKKRVQDLAEREGRKTGETVPSTMVAKWRREIEKEGYGVTEASIRAVLSTLGFSKEGRKKG